MNSRWKNDIGESFEVCKYHTAAFKVLSKFTTDQGLLIVNDGDSLVLVSRIAKAILDAVSEERIVCAEIINKYSDAAFNGGEPKTALDLDMIELEIKLRDFTEAKKYANPIRNQS